MEPEREKFCGIGVFGKLCLHKVPTLISQPGLSSANDFRCAIIYLVQVADAMCTRPRFVLLHFLWKASGYRRAILHEKVNSVAALPLSSEPGESARAPIHSLWIHSTSATAVACAHDGRRRMKLPVDGRKRFCFRNLKFNSMHCQLEVLISLADFVGIDITERVMSIPFPRTTASAGSKLFTLT